ncbi:kinase D-interacting substrate of 220 kDa-like [Haliotis rubra]|uniref:kinase D-interacting substrate of 220 kDa-like n=1 Tax=Haliotis rubra TaxID=36100 RepID=UPI001EE59A9E|nr:kinase D-interacting substrate of 220 kDa-like [Haliotis rubra]
MSIVRHLLSLKTININRRDHDNMTPVMIAAGTRHADVYHLLVSEGADVSLTDNKGRDCLMYACERGNVSVVRHLLSLKTININRRDHYDMTPVMMSAGNRHADVYHLLVSKGADVSFSDNMGRDCLMYACERRNVSIVRHLLSLKRNNINSRDRCNCTPVAIAAKAGQSDVYHLLVSEGADLSLTDDMGRDCLMYACERGSMSIVRHLLSLKSININRRDRWNKTPVMVAVQAGRSDVYQLLVSEEADLSLTDNNGRDCLMYACNGDDMSKWLPRTSGNMSIVRHLLSLKTININRRDHWNKTPVMVAAQAGRSDVYHLLVSEGSVLVMNTQKGRFLTCYENGSNTKQGHSHQPIPVTDEFSDSAIIEKF